MFSINIAGELYCSNFINSVNDFSYKPSTRIFFLTFPSMQPNTVKQANFHKNVFQQKTSNAKANRVEREKKKQGKW